MSERRISLAADRPLREQPDTGHNRWHPELAPLSSVAPGETLTLETRDGFDAQLGRTSGHGDVASLSRGVGHPLTGPIAIETAEPGDVLEVELLRYETADFGITPIIPGFGLLAEEFPDPFLVTWEIRDATATSGALPGVRVPGDPFLGVIGVAPSPAFLEEQLEREARLRELGHDVPPSCPEDAIPAGTARGLRTIPPRSNGVNVDIRYLTLGSRVFLDVQVAGALLSVGDIHFAQGDGECAGTAIEVSGAVTLRCQVHKGTAWRPSSLAYESAPRSPGRCIATTGVPADDHAQRPMDVRGAARAALREMIELLSGLYGFEREAAYALCSAAADLHISELVNVPYPLVSALVPMDIFSSPPELTAR